MTFLLLALAIAALLYVLIDRSSRAAAWRRIAEERRWNAEAHAPKDPNDRA